MLHRSTFPAWKSLFLIPTLAFGGAAAKEKPATWVQVQSPHFTVVSNANEKQARTVASHFERIRSVFQKAFPGLRVDTNAPFVVLAAKDERTFHALEPAPVLQKGQKKRSGLFIRNAEKNYVLLDLSVQEANPYQVPFHEYTHLLLHQNMEDAPVWLDEGLAEFYANSEIREGEVWLGQPSREHVLLLRERRLLPLETLFAVDHGSPYYKEDDKASIFYAQSWAFTHYLMIKGFQEGKSPLGYFLDFLDQHLEPREAATRAFGDLKKTREGP